MSGFLNVWVKSPDTHSERRIDPHLTVEQLKGKLEPITGISASNQIITLLQSESDPTVIAAFDDDSKKLGYYGLRDWQVIKVDDANPAASFTGQLNDYSQVEKFELSEREYASRNDTVLAFKQRNKIGRFSEKSEEQELEEPPVDITAGSRCEVESSESGLNKRGTVRFVGPTKFGKGTWVGIEYDEPFGKNDGSVQGERYFSCRPLYGAFVKPERVKVGDYPMLELDFDEDEEI
ncbi:tubulin-folding cofactor B [Coprinopsis marcescibilis]|uniref:Tubulin-folding cofactor B n=1 Tax=Coprinopsis marcescibilis TaxID=230819 RepID=A0A5C3KIG9_COPMA|nr:tubulin-folding cofactor B [Coprinopsis marcescibilis]